MGRTNTRRRAATKKDVTLATKKKQVTKAVRTNKNGINKVKKKKSSRPAALLSSDDENDPDNMEHNGLDYSGMNYNNISFSDAAIGSRNNITKLYILLKNIFYTFCVCFFLFFL